MKKALLIPMLFLSTVTHAAPPDSTSKEDQNLEAQGDASGMLFTHGIGEVEYRTQFTSSGALGSVGLRIETTVVKPFPLDYSNLAVLAPLPFEIRVVIDPSNTTVFAPEKVRADALKFLFPSLGLTLKAIGYSFEQLQAGDARLNGIHVLEATLSEVVAIDGKNGADFAITIKGDASIGGGTDDYPTGMTTEITRDWKDANYIKGDRSYNGAAMEQASGSIGLRIKEAVLIELFGGANQFYTPATRLIDLEYGAKARVMLLDKKLQFTTSVSKQESAYYGSSKSQNYDNGIRLIIGVEGHW